ncbi:hypothetical protein H7F15_04110 [Pontibacter sp. Tf4]|uniref:hypothetical protein n=1 Tax=Pontibacter sp. Tf4 TaxID=2761620 RepID=UPI001627B859|nr:hypothetical protein [Pontibacter sp. Tf4]MBB6610214.1 hypothetical protein [Pontibacter sp. Tf4]
MALAFNNLRKGSKYRLQNHGETFEFVVMEIQEGDRFILKDLHTLELYQLQDLLRYGKGKDYDLSEL